MDTEPYGLQDRVMMLMMSIRYCSMVMLSSFDIEILQGVKELQLVSIWTSIWWFEWLCTCVQRVPMLICYIHRQMLICYIRCHQICFYLFLYINLVERPIGRFRFLVKLKHAFLSPWQQCGSASVSTFAALPTDFWGPERDFQMDLYY